MTLDSTLNAVIPPLIILLIIGLVYIKAKDPIDSLFATIRGWFSPKEDSGGGDVQPAIGSWNIEYVG